MNRSRHVLIALLALWVLAGAPRAQAGFDLRHPAWDAQLKQQVVVAPGGVASTVRYAALRADPKALMGEQRSLDDVEDGLIRAPGVFDDPRIHAVVVCASVGCPMLREEAYVGARLGAQLDDAMRRFLGTAPPARAAVRAGRFKLRSLDDAGRSTMRAEPWTR